MTRSFTLRTLTMVLAATAFACGGWPTETPTDQDPARETFIATYVALRTAVIQGDNHQLTDGERTRILAEHGVTEDDLNAFVATHGEDVEFMQKVWDEVEARLDQAGLQRGTEERR